MPRINRREASIGLAAAAAGLASAGARAGLAPAQTFDLVLKGGEVIDPSQGLRGRRDVGFRDGRVAAVADEIPADRAGRVPSAAGRLVVPGFVDLHQRGVRLPAFLRIANTGPRGVPLPELYNIDMAAIDAAASVLSERRDRLLGIGLRLSDNVVARHGVEPLSRAIRACERSGTGARVLCQIGAVEAEAQMTAILNALRPADVLTGCYCSANVAGTTTGIVRRGKVLAAALAAKRRGVLFDVGHGASFDETIAAVALSEGLPPDIVPPDLQVMNGLLELGVSLDEVIAMATSVPAHVLAHGRKLGTLQVGAPADATLLELVEGPVAFVDTRADKRHGGARLKPAGTVVAGVPFGRPHGSPFALR